MEVKVKKKVTDTCKIAKELYLSITTVFSPLLPPTLQEDCTVTLLSVTPLFLWPDKGISPCSNSLN